jgi:hypothetical protein
VQVSAFWAALLRRWYLLVAALLCTSAATVFFVNRIGPTYEAQGTTLLFPPVATVQQGDVTQTLGNPYLMLGGLTQARDIVIRTITSKSAREQLAKAHPDVQYTATQDYTTGGPLVLVTTKAPTADEAVAGLDAVVAEIPKSLEALQADLDLDSNAQITSKQITADRTPDVVHKSQIRGGIVVGAAVLVVSLLLIGLFDGLASSRGASRRGGGGGSGRRAKREPEEPEDGGGAHVTQLPRRVAASAGSDSATSSSG